MTSGHKVLGIGGEQAFQLLHSPNSLLPAAQETLLFLHSYIRSQTFYSLFNYCHPPIVILGLSELLMPIVLISVLRTTSKLLSSTMKTPLGDLLISQMSPVQG